MLRNLFLSFAASERYQILTKTGDKLFAGTDANVFINLIGDFGETGAGHTRVTSFDGFNS